MSPLTDSLDIEGQKPTFRTCGRGTGGVMTQREQKNPYGLRRGGEDDWRTPASIPSKLETQLIVGAKEINAFGSNTQRFYDSAVEACREVPGPGSYGTAKAFHEEVTQNVSQGKKGTGAFASKSRRMPSITLGSGPRGHPGAGAYDNLPPKLPQGPGSDTSRRNSAAFVVPSSFNPMNAYPKFTPGPGQYETKRASSAKGPGVRSCSSAFQRGDERGVRGDQPMSARDYTPGPGEYERDSLRMPMSARSAPSSRTGHRSCSASFRGPSEKRMVSVHPGLPVDAQTVARTMETLKDFVKPITGAKQETPGPGHYSSNMEDVRQEFSCYSTLGSSCFQKGTQDKPRKWRPEVPGPGDYNTDSLSKGPNVGYSSVFSSNVERLKDPTAKAPGPAFYAPKGNAKAESFHLNIRRKWI